MVTQSGRKTYVATYINDAGEPVTVEGEGTHATAGIREIVAQVQNQNKGAIPESLTFKDEDAEGVFKSFKRAQAMAEAGRHP